MELLNITSSTGPTKGWQSGSELAGDRLPAVGDPLHPSTREVLGERFLERFWAFVQKSPKCWLWTAGLDAYGYGQIARPGKSPIKVHRAAWMLAHGPVESHQHVLHKCDVRNCVRPSHLFLGDQAANMKDAAAKGRLGNRPRPSVRVVSAEAEQEIRDIYQSLPPGARLPRGLRQRLARRFGVTGPYITLLGMGKTGRAVTPVSRGSQSPFLPQQLNQLSNRQR